MKPGNLVSDRCALRGKTFPRSTISFGSRKNCGETFVTESVGIRFLVVDDEESIRRLCVTVAAGLGFTCMEASNGQDAVSLLEEQPAHIILTDLVMPQMSGIE